MFGSNRIAGGKILQQLSQGMKVRDFKSENLGLIRKWNDTGLLKGLTDNIERANMAVLLENQTRQMLHEASQMSAGDVAGFASVAFPLVRRAFGNLIANKIVSVQ